MTEIFNSKTCNYTFNNGFSDTNPRNAVSWKFNQELENVGSITVQLSKKSGYTGTIKGEIWDTDGTSLQTTSSINASVLDTNDGTISSYQEHTFDFTSHDLTTGQFIGLHFSDPVGTDFLYVARSNTPNNCTNPTVTWHSSEDGGSTWDAGNTYVGGVIIEDTPAPPPTGNGTFMPPPIAHVRL